MSNAAPSGNPAGRIRTYPAPPGAEPGRSHRVRVLGRHVFVERHAGVVYARFAMQAPVGVEIEVASDIARHVIFPSERVASVTVAGSVLRIELAAAASVVVWIDELEKLILLPDPLDDDEPDPGGPGVLDVRGLGADATGRALSTGVIQAAIDRAARLPAGGTVLVPYGRYRSGTLTLKSDVRLHLAAGAVLEGSADPGDYPLDPGRHETAADEGLPPEKRYLGRTMTFSRLLLIDRARNVRISGHGTIDGSGTFLRTRFGAAPNLLRVRESRGVRLDDVLFRNSAAWTVHLLASRDVRIRNMKMINDRSNLNTDGIDPDMSSDVTIEGCFIHTKDDGICVKATGNSDLAGDPVRIVVRDNLVSSVDAALKIGSETAAAVVSDIAFENNFVFDSGRAMSIVVLDGATLERVAFRGIRVGPNVEHLVEQVIGVRTPAAVLGEIRDLTLEAVTAPAFRAPASNWTWYAQFRSERPGPGMPVNVFEGADERHAVERLRLAGVVVNGGHLRDAAAARSVANLTIGPYVRSVTWE